MTTSPASVRHVQIGQCQLCEASHKLHGGLVVLHGYKRPGHGSIVGDCDGTRHLPYEQSCDMIELALALAEQHLPSAREKLAAFDAGEVTSVSFLAKDRRGNLITVNASIATSSPSEWRRALEHAHSEARMTVSSWEASIARFTKRIAAWKLCPVIETTEEAITAAEQVEKDQRAKVKADAKKAKADKRAALAAKAEKRKQALRVVLDGFAAQFNALAAQPKSDARDAAARALASSIQAPKYEKIGGYWGFMDLGCDPALIELGLAEASPNPAFVGRACRYILPAYVKAA